MDETFVRLLCPDCGKSWELTPSALPNPRAQFECDDCEAERRTAEFTRTDHDLEVLKQFR